MGAYWKAILAGALAGLTAIGTGLTDDHLTAAELVAAGIAALAAGAAVWRVPNVKPPEREW